MLLGGEISGAAAGCAFLDFSRHGRFWCKIASGHKLIFGKSFLMALIAVPYKLGLPSLCPAGRLFKFKEVV